MNEICEARVEVERELQVRFHVYPRLIEQGKLTKGEADRRMRALRYVLYLLEQCQYRNGKLAPLTTE